jgi:pyruvate kinase
MDPSPGSARRVQLPHPEDNLAAAGFGTTLLLDDGKLRLRVNRNRGDHLECEVLTGGARCRIARASMCRTSCCGFRH